MNTIKTLLLTLLLAPAAALAQSATIDLPSPQTIALDQPVHTATCYADTVTITPYATAVTGFSADENYVTGQVKAHFTCGHSGRGANIHTYYSCAQLTWDLAGNLVSASDVVTDSNGLPVSYSCPDLGLVLPSRTPPSDPTIGNSFTSSTGYTAYTYVVQPCGSIACYGQPYTFPELQTP